jgi:hypothetical protein
LKKYEIHELILPSDPPAKPGGVARGAICLYFFEVVEGDVILVDDKVVIDEIPVCDIKGYDETQAPNHINAICYDDKVGTGRQPGLRVDSKVVISRLWGSTFTWVRAGPHSFILLSLDRY